MTELAVSWHVGVETRLLNTIYNKLEFIRCTDFLSNSLTSEGTICSHIDCRADVLVRLDVVEIDCGLVILAETDASDSEKGTTRGSG